MASGDNDFFSQDSVVPEHQFNVYFSMTTSPHVRVPSVIGTGLPVYKSVKLAMKASATGPPAPRLLYSSG